MRYANKVAASVAMGTVTFGTVARGAARHGDAEVSLKRLMLHGVVWAPKH